MPRPIRGVLTVQLRRINRRQRSVWTPVAAVIASVSVFAAAAFGGHDILKTQEIGSGPIDPAVNSASFADGATTVVDDPAIASQGEGDGPRAVKEFHRDEAFSQFALTWSGERDIAAFVRAKQPDGSWSEWYDTTPIGNEGSNGKTGTELIYVGQTNDVQVSVSNVDLYQDNNDNILDQAANTINPLLTNVGDIAPVADTMPSDLDVVFIDGKAQSGIAPVADYRDAGMPSVVSRAGWGANEGIRCQQPTDDGYVKALTLHHTAGKNTYTQADAVAQVRGIYAYHAQTLGWCDIGYNVLVDKFGTIYEGRYGGLDRAIQGAHVGGFNSHNWGISMIGNYETAQPSQEMLDSVASIAGWKAAKSGFSPSSTVSLTSGGFNGSRYAAGQTYTGPAFLGHSDLHFTQCPGANTIARWGEIRANATTKYNAIKNGGGAADDLNINDGINSGWDHASTPKTPNSNATSSIGGTEVPMSTIEALIGIAAALIGIVGASNVDGMKVDQKAELAGGITVGEVPNIVSKVIAVTGNEGLAETWTAVLNAFGPVLGLPVGGPDFKDVDSQLVSQLFTNGVVLSSKDTGTHALVGDIAKKWAENPQALGLPTSDEYKSADGATIRVDFQGGYITFDPASGQAQVFTN